MGYLVISLSVSLSSRNKLNKVFFADPKQEIIDLKNASFVCNGISPEPFRLTAAAGGLVEGNVPMICGGSHSNWERSLARRECYSLKNKKWKHVFNLKLARKYVGTGSVVINGKLLVNGGEESRWSKKQTELVSADGTDLAHDMPKPGVGHCNIKLNESTILIAASSRFSPFSQTYFQNVLTGDVIQGPMIKKARSFRPRHGPGLSPSCGLVNFGNKPHAIYVDGREKKVYALDLNDLTRGWKMNSYSKFKS